MKLFCLQLAGVAAFTSPRPLDNKLTSDQGKTLQACCDSFIKEYQEQSPAFTDCTVVEAYKENTTDTSNPWPELSKVVFDCNNDFVAVTKWLDDHKGPRGTCGGDGRRMIERQLQGEGRRLSDFDKVIHGKYKKNGGHFAPLEAYCYESQANGWSRTDIDRLQHCGKYASDTEAIRVAFEEGQKSMTYDDFQSTTCRESDGFGQAICYEPRQQAMACTAMTPKMMQDLMDTDPLLKDNSDVCSLVLDKTNNTSTMATRAFSEVKITDFSEGLSGKYKKNDQPGVCYTEDTEEGYTEDDAAKVRSACSVANDWKDENGHTVEETYNKFNLHFNNYMVEGQPGKGCENFLKVDNKTVLNELQCTTVNKRTLMGFVRIAGQDPAMPQTDGRRMIERQNAGHGRRLSDLDKVMHGKYKKNDEKGGAPMPGWCSYNKYSYKESTAAVGSKVSLGAGGRVLKFEALDDGVIRINRDQETCTELNLCTLSPTTKYPVIAQRLDELSGLVNDLARRMANFEGNLTDTQNRVVSRVAFSPSGEPFRLGTPTTETQAKVTAAGWHTCTCKDGSTWECKSAHGDGAQCCGRQAEIMCASKTLEDGHVSPSHSHETESTSHGSF
jgi:hypothetical protein